MGRSRPVWQAALAGATVGTLPDLDVFVAKGDAVLDMVLHRAETHAFFWQALASPLIAAMPAALTRSFSQFGRWWLMVILVLFTHSLLDAMTIYGTQLGLPFTDYPVGFGSLFIIDPLYTLPLIVGLLGTLVMRRSLIRWRWNTAGLVLSTMYAGWSLGAQAHVAEVALSAPEANGIPRERILVTPAPFNTLLWRIVLVGEDHYHEGFYSLLDPLAEPARPVHFERLDRGGELEAKTAEFDRANRIRDFSKGFYKLADDGHRVWITDLRMGQHPFYAFSFAFAEHQSEPLSTIRPQRSVRRLPFADGLTWLWRRVQGHDVAPPPAVLTD